MAFTMTVAEVIAADTSGLLSKHDSWERVPLADIANILNGAPFDSSLFSTNDGVPLVRIRDVLTGETSTYYTGSYDDLYVVKPGDLLVGMDGGFNCGFWGNQRALLNQRVCKVTPDESYYDKRFLEYALPGYLSAINANTPSVTVKHLSSKTIGEIDLPLPPRLEQTRIVEKLEELFSDLDAGVAELKAAQKKLAQYRQSLLKAAVEGELTAEWRRKNGPLSPTPLPQRGEGLYSPASENSSRDGIVDHDPQQQEGLSSLPSPLCGRGAGGEGESGAQLLARILAERRARWEEKQLAKFKEQGKTPPKGWRDKYPEPMQLDTANLPELPEGWVWASVDQICPDDIANGKSVPTAESGPKVLRLTAVKTGRIDLEEFKHGTWSDRDAEPFFVKDGDILIVRGNGSLSLVGRAGLVSGVTSNVAYPDTMIRVRVLETIALPAWVRLVWDSALVRDHLQARARTSAGIYKIAQPDIVSVIIPIPPLVEQEAIIAALDEASQEIQVVETSLSRGYTQAAAQRKNILKAAFSGQLVPQDPNDEPASALLERIRAERAARAAKEKTGRRSARKGAAHG